MALYILTNNNKHINHFPTLSYDFRHNIIYLFSLVVYSNTVSYVFLSRVD